MQILINLKVKWYGDEVIVKPLPQPDPEPIPEPTTPEEMLPDGYITLEELSEDVNKAWEIALQQDGKILKLKDNKIYKITEHTTVEPKLKAIVGNMDKTKRPTLEIGSWDKPFTSRLFLFESDICEFAIVGVNMVQPKGQTFKTAIQMKTIFNTKPNTVKKGNFALIGSEPSDMNQLSWALAGFIYSPNSETDFINVIAKDVIHNGPVFQQLKTNTNNRLRSIWDNVKIHNQRDSYFVGEQEYFLPTHYYNPTKFINKSLITENKIISLDKPFDLVKTHHGYEDINVRTIFQVDRFVFNVYDNSISENGMEFTFNPVKPNQTYNYDTNTNYGPKGRTIVSNAELQPGDIINLGTVLEKQIQNNATNGKWYRWSYVLDKNVEEKSGTFTVLNSTFNISGEHNTLIAYKYNAMFSSPFLTTNTKFNDWYVGHTGGIGWTTYDHRQINIYWKNSEITGFVRMSSNNDSLKTIGYNVENVNFKQTDGEFRKLEPYSDIVVLPDDVDEFINQYITKDDIIEFTDEFYNLIKQDSEIILESGKTYRVNTLQNTEVDRKLHFKTNGDERANILIGVEKYLPETSQKQSGSLFKLKDGAEFLSENINWCLPPQHPKAERYVPNLFGSDRDPNATWTAIIKDCDTTALGNNGGMGVGVLYGSIGENHVALINYKHHGHLLMDLKNSDPECVIALTMDNVQTHHNQDTFNPNFIPCQIRFSDDFSGFNLDGDYGTHCAEVKEQDTFYVLSNQFYNRGWNNRLNMIHIDRFTFWLPSSRFLQAMVDPILNNRTDWDINDRYTQTNIGSKVIVNQIPVENKKYRLSREYWIKDLETPDISKNKIRSFGNWNLTNPDSFPIEFQVGDIIEINELQYKVIHKERGNNWHIEHEYRQTSGKPSQYIFSSLTLDKDLPNDLPLSFEAKVIKSSAKYLIDGKYRDAFMVYKGNSSIDITENEKFGDKQILHSSGFGHLAYNHKEISLWARDVNFDGFYRQSSGKGKTLYYNIINSNFRGEFNPPIEVKNDLEMPERIKKLLMSK